MEKKNKTKAKQPKIASKETQEQTTKAGSWRL